jgi:hypothetical protein
LNPNITLKPWLLACGKQFGINNAYEYKWPDEETRPEIMYFTFQSLTGEPTETGYADHSTVDDSNTVTRKGSKFHLQTWQIDLHNSQDGMCELEGCCIAAQQSGAIRELFAAGGCEFQELLTVTNETRVTDERVYWHFRAIVTFGENPHISLEEVNGEVEQMDLTLAAGDPTYEITRTGITVT